MPTYIHKICLQCNIEFLVLPRDKNKKFCTYKCYNNYTVYNSKKERRINCLNCNAILANNKNKFCSHSCSATYSNKNRDNISCYAKQSSTLKEHNATKLNFCELCNKSYIGNKIDHKFNCTGTMRKRKSKQLITINQPKLCASCGVNQVDLRKKYCADCFPNIRYYRTLCTFTFNVFDYPDDFAVSLINDHGWFSPNGFKRRNKTPNLTGASRDHLYNVVDGFKNKVDPKLLAHPANCRIMLHNGPNGNNSKKKSTITLEKLLERIKNWDLTH
jgi:hypothetical protein